MIDPHSNAEKNARLKARGVYYRWLVRQYGSIPLMEMADDPDPISLRQIYIPLRLGDKDVDDGSMNPPDKFKEETEANQLGQDAFDEVLSQRFLVISGRPGAGKTTFVKALVNELCGSYSSPFRSRMQKQIGNVLVMPIILRELPRIAEADSLEALLAMWWEHQVALNTQARLPSRNINSLDGDLRNAEPLNADPLDVDRLQASLTHDNFTILLLFDGVDEVGCLEIRERIFKFATHAVEHSRIILTGRPSGLADLQNFTVVDGERVIPQAWRFVLPLTRPQIDTFITKWYHSRPEWISKFQAGTDDFRKALSDPSRPHLLSLARRPIFLTLMSLVHCTRNEMPHGRAALYRAIVDLYLERQQRNRRLRESPDGKPMPQWDSNEPRIALGYLAWLSMQKGAEQQEKQGESDRRIVWKKEELLVALKKALEDKTLRFAEVKSSEAGSLLAYYLYPAGLLIEPADGYIQFAHLSFQEYLCAEYLQGRMSGLRMTKEWSEKVLSMLDRPGWYEVALLLLAVHADRTQNQGHFELLGLLDVSKNQEARLFFMGLLGKELPIGKEERLQWLPLLLMAALVNPSMQETKVIKDWPELNDVGLVYVETFALEVDPRAQFDYLLKLLLDNPPLYIQENIDDIGDIQKEAKKLWISPESSPYWNIRFGEQEARNHALLSLIVNTQWGINIKNSEHPVNSNKIMDFVLSCCQKDEWLWQKDDNNWKASLSLVYAELLFERNHETQWAIQHHTPLSAWLSQVDMLLFTGHENNYLSFLSGIYVKGENLCQRLRLMIATCQLVQLLRLAGFRPGNSVHPHNSLWQRVTSNFLFFAKNNAFDERYPWLKHGRRVSHDRIRFALGDFFGHWYYMVHEYHTGSLFISLSWGLLRNDWVRRIKVNDRVNKKSNSFLYEKKYIFEKVFRAASIEENEKKIEVELLDYLFSYGAIDWFAEQVENPSLVINRGGRVGEPLPRYLGLFDEQGMPLICQKRENFVQLWEWVSNDDNWLEWVFPEGLSSEDKQLLQVDLAELKTHDWSPYGVIKAILDAWPEDQIEQDWSFESREKALVTVCEVLIAKHDKKLT